MYEGLPDEFVLDLQIRPIRMRAPDLFSAYAPVNFAQLEREQHSLLSRQE
jgi:hypothetical protein